MRLRLAAPLTLPATNPLMGMTEALAFPVRAVAAAVRAGARQRVVALVGAPVAWADAAACLEREEKVAALRSRWRRGQAKYRYRRAS